MNKKHIGKDIEELVLTRLAVFPEGKKISIGSLGDFTKEEIIRHVQDKDEVGQKMIEIELKYLQSMKEISKQVLANG